MLQRYERIGLVVALAFHAGLGALLWLSPGEEPEPPTPPAPISVFLTDDVALDSAAPVLAPEPPPSGGVPDPQPEPAPPEPEPEPEPVTRPDPVPPRPRPDPAAPRQPPPPRTSPPRTTTPPRTEQPKQNQRPQRTQRSNRLDNLDLGPGDAPRTNAPPRGQPARTIGPQVQSALSAEIIRQIKPHWRPPTGADSGEIRTTVRVTLARDGTIVGDPVVIRQTGVTASNAAQAALHKERAIRAVRVAAPFNLPDQYYEAWKTIEPTLYEGL